MNTKGFTLIETLVASSILTLAVVGPMFTASRAIVAAQISRDQITASYLAQEGIEHVRAIRDNEYLHAFSVGGSNISSLAWSSFASLMDACGGGVSNSKCSLDPMNPIGVGGGNSLQSCSGTCPSLYLGNGMYTQDSSVGVQTPFTRSIQVTYVSASDERVVSTVSWSFHGTTHSVVVTDHLTSWQ